MSDTWFAILVAIVLLIFAGVGVVLLLWPSQFLHHFQNPLQPDTPVTRVQMRGIGFMLCLLILMKVNRRYLAGEADDPKWELRMSLVFCSLFSLIVVSAFFLARSGLHPK
jgi:hypothetical protein